MTDEQFERAEMLNKEIWRLSLLIEQLERESLELRPCSYNTENNDYSASIEHNMIPSGYWELYEDMDKILVSGLKKKLEERKKEFAEL